MKLKLTRPIVFFDLETTGLTIGKDHIVEISLVKVFPDEHRETMTMRINPGMPIPPEATAVHHISDADVADKPRFKEVAKTIAAYIEGCDLGGFNSNKFDIPMLAEEFLACGMQEVDLRRASFIDVQNIFHKKEQRTLAAAYQFYCHKDLVGAHGAEADTMATADVFFAQVDKYDDLPTDIPALAAFCAMNKTVDYAGRMVYDDKNEIIFNFGKYKGRPVKQVLMMDPSYYDWMMNSDFSLDTKRALTQVRLSMNARINQR
ncbi:MAG: 3'-5' exonuclease [Bacteroidales bacterium]|jgi:DNA polymerase-3 subunit epsilon|nr:3'-5' exonuclease [Bacteroidales bacterium]